MSFASLLRRSNFAAFERNTPITAASATDLASGDYGLKRTLPPKIGRPTSLVVRDLDTEYSFLRAHDGSIENERAAAHDEILASPDGSVKGRILNKVPGGYAVGICGVVAFLPSSPTHMLRHRGFDTDRRKVHQFFIEKMQWGNDGKPDIVVTMRERKEAVYASSTGLSNLLQGSNIDLQKLLSRGNTSKQMVQEKSTSKKDIDILTFLE